MGEIGAGPLAEPPACIGCRITLEDGEHVRGFPGYCSQTCAREYGGRARRNARRQVSRARAHHQPRPFGCPHCTRRFRIEAALRDHTKDKHGDVT